MMKYMWFVVLLWLGLSPFVYAQNKGDYGVLLAEGITHLEKKELAAALQRFEAALKADPKGVEAHYYLGVSHARANRDDVAEGHFEEALSLDRTFVPARFDLGVLYYQTRKDDKAMAAFNAVEQIDPQRAKVHYYQGLILRRNGKKTEGEAKLKRAVEIDPGLEVSLQFQTAAAHYEAGTLDSARAAFQKVVNLSPDGELSESARALMNKIDTLSKDEKRWAFSASLGLQYDDNVVLDSGNVPLPSGITEKDDLLGVVYLTGKYRWLKKDLWNGDLEYRFYQNLHLESSLEDFNIQDHHLKFSVQKQMAEHELGLAYEFQYASLGGESYLSAHRIGPVFHYRHSVGHFTVFDYVYGMKDFKNITPFFRSNTVRDVDAHQLGFTHYTLFGDQGNVYAGYHYEMEEAGDSTEEDDWSYDGHRLKLGVVLPPWAKWVLSLEGVFQRRDYDHVNSQSLNVAREDDDLLFIAVLSHPVTEHTTLSVQYLYEQNDSNIPVFDYARNIAGLVLTAEF